MVAFRIDAYNNAYLPEDETDTDAILSVEATDDGSGVPSGAEYAEVIILDCSGSMGNPASKILSTRRAAAVAIDNLRPGVLFAVVRGNSKASVVYPEGGHLARVTADSRAAAKARVATLRAEGGTAIGRWLSRAGDLLAGHPAAIRHAILLTDGQNEHETEDEFARALASCEGRFTCDPRGIGRDWVAEELNRIADTLHGTAVAIAKPGDLVEDFQAMTQKAMARALPEVSLHVWVPKGAHVRRLEQVHPTIVDLTSRGMGVGAQTTAYPTGNWGAETRDYHLALSGLQPFHADRPSRIAKAELVSGTRALASASVEARWTSDQRLYSQVSHQVTQSVIQIELGQEINLGTAALRDGDTGAALTHLGKAARLAHARGDSAKLDLIATLVTIEDAATGRVRPLDELDPYLTQVADVRSRYTRPVER